MDRDLESMSLVGKDGKRKRETQRNKIGEILYGTNSDFKYRGHGNNLGMW